jgi:hypothetical protein
MIPPPTVVLASLGAIALPGLLFAVTTALDGAPGVGALFLLLPLSAYGCFRAVKLARAAMFVVAMGALGPLFVGIMMTWPEASSSVPYIAGAGAIIAGLSGMLSPTARAWHASKRAHGLLDI